MNSKKMRWYRPPAIVVLAFLLLLAGGFFWYISNYYPAQDVAIAMLCPMRNGIAVQGNLTILSPQPPSDIGLILLSRGQGGSSGLSALLDQIRQLGLTCILMDMPFRIAVFDPDAA